MRLGDSIGQLTYCTNVHPGEGLAEVMDALSEHAVRVKALVCPNAPFAIGLRLSAHAASELEEPGRLDELRALLASQGLYVFTINGFPYGDFHGTRVKERVYLPDWREATRLAYTDRLARLLAELLPEQDLYGSISTVPGAFKAEVATGDVERITHQLVRHVAQLVQLERDTGRHIVLALEPEPHCMLETVAETVAFFERNVWAPASLTRLGATLGISESEASRALHRHLGVCLDLCHAAVEYEDPQTCIEALESAGVLIAKVQISAGLTLDPRKQASREALTAFRDEVYLHQVVARSAQELTRYADLPEAEAALSAGAGAEEWRVHFHVPIFHAELSPLGTTQNFVRAALARHRTKPISQHLEVETYTWGVLPAALRDAPVHESIARELTWARGELGA